MYDDLPDEVKSTIRRGASEVAKRYGRRPAQGVAVIRANVSKVGTASLDVTYQGATLAGVPMTTACEGASVGDTALALSSSGTLVAIGIIKRTG